MIQLAHCKGHYYREFAYKLLDTEKSKPEEELRRIKSTPIRKDSDIAALLSAFGTRNGLYVSVYSFAKLTDKGTVDYSSAVIDRIYLDFDNKENPQKAINEALLAVKVLAKHGIFCHAYFSGNKGIALYIEFRDVDIAPENKKEVLAEFFDLVLETVREDYENFFGLWIPTVKKGLGATFGVTLGTLDTQIRGDIARVSRLPNTRHAKGLYCIPVSFGDMRKGIEHIKTLARQPREYDLKNAILKNMMRNEKMSVIIKNLEKVVIADRIKVDKLKGLKQEYSKEQSKKIKKHGNASITERDIEKAKSVPLSDFLGHEKMVCCPFHNDSNPSLSVDHENGLWHCFGCGKGGDVITFVMEKHGLEFKDAILKLKGVRQ